MARVQFRTGPATTNGQIAQLIVDGTDITDHVLAEGFEIKPSKPGDPTAEWIVQMRISAHLDVDLPDAVVSATRAEVR